MAEAKTGHCLCGAVTITVRSHADAVSACHCSMCRRWSGSAFWGFEAHADAVDIAGPVRTYRSSSFAERAWCDACGSHIWFRDIGADYELPPGLFQGARNMPLVREVYADQALASVPLAGDHVRVTRTGYEKTHKFVEGEA